MVATCKLDLMLVGFLRRQGANRQRDTLSSRLRVAGFGLAVSTGLAAAPLAAAEAILPEATDVVASAGAVGCGATTAAAAQACARQAQADHFLTLGICANLQNANRRQQCIRQADRVLTSAQGDCREQREVREQICRALGPGPYDPVIRPADFVSDITDPFLKLVTGITFTYGGDRTEAELKAPLREPVTILGVECLLVEDNRFVDGELRKQTLEYYAQDRAGNVWLFGQNVAEYANGVIVSTEGSWIAGVDGAKPGIVMPANPRPGMTFREEFALGVAEDVRRIEALGQRVRVPFGTFTDTVTIVEFTPLAPQARERKIYAREIGLVLIVDLETGKRLPLTGVSLGTP